MKYKDSCILEVYVCNIRTAILSLLCGFAKNRMKFI